MNSAHNTGASPEPQETPGTDMQPEDAGTAASGNSGRGTAAEGAMKQTAKTAAESGTRGQGEPRGGTAEQDNAPGRGA